MLPVAFTVRPWLAAGPSSVESIWSAPCRHLYRLPACGCVSTGLPPISWRSQDGPQHLLPPPRRHSPSQPPPIVGQSGMMRYSKDAPLARKKQRRRRRCESAFFGSGGSEAESSGLELSVSIWFRPERIRSGKIPARRPSAIFWQFTRATRRRNGPAILAVVSWKDSLPSDSAGAGLGQCRLVLTPGL
jgi:hypothetical protein